MALGDPIGPTLLRELAFVVLALVLPGLALQKALRLQVDPALVLPLGLVSCGTAYWLSLVTDHAWAFPAVLGIVLVAGGIGALQSRTWRREPRAGLAGALVPLLACVAVLAWTQFGLNRVDETGSFLLDPGEGVDTAFHIAVTWELVDGYPPEVPGMSGVPLRYHIGTHLVRAAAQRWAGIHPYDSMTRFDPALWSLLVILVLRAAAHRLGASPLAVHLAGWIPLAADLSFALAPWAPGTWWAAVFGATLLEALLFANSVLPAVAVAVAVLLALSRAEEGEGRAWVAVAVVLAFAVPMMKVFVAAHLLVGLATFWLWSTEKRWTGLPVLACLLAAWMVVGQQGAASVTVAIEPGAMPRVARALWGFSAVEGGALAAWSLVWLIASLGARLLAIGPALRGLAGHPGHAGMSAMALIGWPAALFLRISGDGHFNEAVYFLTTSGPILWLFALDPIARLVAGRGAGSWLWRLALAAAVLTSSIHYVVRKAATPAARVPAAAVRAVHALASHSRWGDVVAVPPHTQSPPLAVVLIGRRVPSSSFWPYREQFASARELRRRDRALRRLLTASSRDEALDAARRLDAGFLMLRSGQTTSFDPRAWFDLVYEEAGERVYRIGKGD